MGRHPIGSTPESRTHTRQIQLDAYKESGSRQGLPDFISEYRDSTLITPYDLNRLATSVGWVERSPDEWRQAVSAAAATIALLHGAHVVAFGRMDIQENSDQAIGVLSDGMVHPDYQGVGLFKHMLGVAETELAERGITEAVLQAEDGTQTMYEHLGWKPSSDNPKS